MGQRILLSCDRCDCKKEMSVGAGLMTRRPDIIASCLNEKDAGEWRKLYDKNMVASYQPEQKAYYCGHCKELVCQFTVEAELMDGSKVVFGNKCNTCHHDLQEIDLEEENILCPVCGSGTLSWQRTGLWD